MLTYKQRCCRPGQIQALFMFIVHSPKNVDSLLRCTPALRQESSARNSLEEENATTGAISSSLVSTVHVVKSVKVENIAIRILTNTPIIFRMQLSISKFKQFGKLYPNQKGKAGRAAAEKKSTHGRVWCVRATTAQCLYPAWP